MRIGLVGYGRGGRFFHAPLIEQAAGCALAGVATRSPRRRAELARDFPGVPACDGLAGLAAAGVDAVVVSAPVDTHEALVREAIALGGWVRIRASPGAWSPARRIRVRRARRASARPGASPTS